MTRKLWLSLLATLAVAAGVALGLNAVLGQSGDPGPPAARQVSPTPPPSTPPPVPPQGDVPVTHEVPLPTNGTISVASSVIIGGKTVRLPPETTVATGTEEPPPCTPGPRPWPIIMVIVRESWVKFTPEGGLLDSRIDEEEAGALEPVLRELTPAKVPAPLEPCVVINGEVIPLPPGAEVGAIIGECPVGEDGIAVPACRDLPTHFSDVRFGDSWVAFAGDSVLYAHVEPAHQAALEPLLRALKPQVDFALPDGRRIPLPPGVRFAPIYPGPLLGSKYPAEYPLSFMIVETAASWVHFTKEGTIIGSHIEPQDKDLLEPVVSQIRGP